ncbi:MAG: hypothetical protein AAF633_23315 [Chloroflexota bacterium]
MQKLFEQVIMLNLNSLNLNSSIENFERPSAPTLYRYLPES